ncbi:bifunctional aminotransferase class I/II-fold pyridoxal phosphate-dependent enzyme/GNAT family N-acetyltransferase [Galbibacter sp. EGI 63066]|uniref:bifunctional aminotransferase class I/II-fold pyridoxal phosphate-dependent enzyme/GNAT family N-acetyltransferase n=1 Tax=Galbibacter sp. EGI 63066 TaxID=2993559 RepID=UPI0022492FB1|nr:bifunctional aminotransferase class I/II-fold pyridoxal phosphate-dependent enzyme/GNAT family N-acetyltransferase [Galbibacter sp. EGI 63066]MCX2681937.1 bifunctional aminotransferase class I/II-fold pyridoxal phosphate-dependent enzyme/GNAT family N-acetyltransferase [Galbibacter sp. EGI 63066]
MAKIKNNNFLDTVNDVFTDATRQGVLHLYADGDLFTGRKISVQGKNLFHFGTTGYLGLEQDMRLKNAASEAIFNYGTQFPLSKTYISHPLYRELEEKVTQMYNSPVIITKNSSLGHIGVIPSAVADRDAIVLDHQVHWSVQSAAKTLKTRSVPIEMIRHNNLDMLEDKIKKLSSKHKKIWYMADGLYSMYGDEAPVLELMELSNKYPQLHLYFDDVHGMSWVGKNGTGFVMSKLRELPEHVLLFGTLSKTFGASGSVLVCSDRKMYSRIKTFGGPLTFSAQLEPASVAAAIASADIHLSKEIYMLQDELLERVALFNSLLEKTQLPLIDKNNSPVFYIGTGMPITGYNFVNRLMKEGFFVNLGIFPAVPVKNTGVRITISRHNQPEEIRALVQAMEHHYPKALEATHTSHEKVCRAFSLPLTSYGNEKEVLQHGLSVQHEESISRIDKKQWNKLMAGHGVFDWDGLHFLETVFKDNGKREENWRFHYFIIRDSLDKPVLATFFTYALWKEDMLAPETVSKKIEEQRQKDPYYMTSHVLSVGSLFTEGQHLFLDKSHPLWHDALHLLFDEMDKLDRSLNPSMVVLRDFEKDETLNEFFHNHGFIKVSMPDSCKIDNLDWKAVDAYLRTLSSRSRRHFRKDIAPFEARFNIEILDKINPEQRETFYALFENVRKNNLGLNTFAFPEKLMDSMSKHPGWEFIVLTLKGAYTRDKKDRTVGVMFCYKNGRQTYVPAFVGMDYNYAHEHQVYRQLLYQTVKRAGETGFQNIDFGMTAGFEKKKIGATVTSKTAYIQAKDNYSMELMGMMENK